MDLNRTLENTRLLGVCAWISRELNVDVKGVRVFFIVITLLGVGSPILLYLILFLVKALFF